MLIVISLTDITDLQEVVQRYRTTNGRLVEAQFELRAYALMTNQAYLLTAQNAAPVPKLTVSRRKRLHGAAGMSFAAASRRRRYCARIHADQWLMGPCRNAGHRV